MEKPIQMDDLGVPLFSETSIYIYICILIATYFQGLLFPFGGSVVYKEIDFKFERFRSILHDNEI